MLVTNSLILNENPRFQFELKSKFEELYFYKKSTKVQQFKIILSYLNDF